MIAERIPQLRDLSAEEKLILAGELWDELASHPSSFPPRQDHIDLLRQRLESHQQRPDEVIAWADLKARILAQQ